MISKYKINQIIKIIKDNIKPEKIILFGSYANGNPDEHSDLDLLIVKDSDVPRYKRGKEIRKYLRGIGVPLDIIVYTKDEIDRWKNVEEAFITQIMKNGKVLYG
ncbi:MAG TPA: nucleotidyltransferase domain-containing protein [Candidatus Cloacimonetes bacterium]|nr:nucleotidyltransferase domain-containing protein [Candidatus Cloacimonadota bacterium]